MPHSSLLAHRATPHTRPSVPLVRHSLGAISKQGCCRGAGAPECLFQTTILMRMVRNLHTLPAQARAPRQGRSISTAVARRSDVLRKCK